MYYKAKTQNIFLDLPWKFVLESKAASKPKCKAIEVPEHNSLDKKEIWLPKVLQLISRLKAFIILVEKAALFN